jgi:glycosyltransferase 2 family protein
MSIKTETHPKTGAQIVTVVAALLAILFLYLTLRDLDWNTFWNTLINGQYQYLAFIIPMGSISYFLRSLRWGLLIRSEKKIPHLSVFWANMIGYLGNAFLPARAGEVLRSVAISRNFGLSTSFTLATALTERLMDVVALVIISSLSLLSLNLLSDPFSSALKLMAVVGLLGLVVVLFFPLLEKYFLIILKYLPLPQSWVEKISIQVSLFLQGMRTLQNGKKMLAFLILTTLIWLLDGYIAIISVQIVAATINLPQALVLLSALGLSSALPSTPGYIGVYQFAAVSVLAPFGIIKSTALAYILISEITNYAIVSLWGLLGLWKLKSQTVDLTKNQIEV